MTTAFATAAALAETPFRFVTTAPAWTHDAAGGFGRLVPAASDRAHGAWSLAQGDGRYRCLARWDLPGVTPTEARPFGFIGRMTKSGANFLGVRAEVVLRRTGARVLELRQYTGAGTASTTLAAVPLAWAWNAWHWLEMEFEGAAVRARLYPEAGPAPAWQATAATSHVAGGAFGPSAFAVGTQRPNVDIRHLELQPLQAAETPAVPQAGEWVLGQITVQS